MKPLLLNLSLPLTKLFPVLLLLLLTPSLVHIVKAVRMNVAGRMERLVTLLHRLCTAHVVTHCHCV